VEPDLLCDSLTYTVEAFDSFAAKRPESVHGQTPAIPVSGRNPSPQTVAYSGSTGVANSYQISTCWQGKILRLLFALDFEYCSLISALEFK